MNKNGAEIMNRSGKAQGVLQQNRENLPLPKQLKSNVMVVRGMKRNLMEYTSDKTSIGPNDSFKIRINAHGLANYKPEGFRPRLSMSVATTKTSGTFVRLEEPAHCIFERIVVRIGTQKYVDLDRYNLWQAVQYNYERSQDWRDSPAGKGEGFDATATRNSTYAAGREVFMSLNMDFLHKNLPTHKEWELEFFTAGVESCLETDGAGLGYAITNPRMHMEHIELSEQANNALKSSSYIVPYTNIRSQQFIINSGQTSETLRLSHRANDVTGLVIVQRLTGLTSTTLDKLSNWQKDNLSQVVVKDNSGRRFPYENQLDLDRAFGAEAWKEVQQVFNIDNDAASRVAASAYVDADKYVTCINLSPFQHSQNEGASDIILSGVQMDKDMFLELSYSSALGANLEVTVFFLYKSLLKVDGDNVMLEE